MQRPSTHISERTQTLKQAAMRRPSTGPRSHAAAALALALSFVAVSGTPAALAATRATFTVGATVVARAAITSESAPAELEVSARDVERGFVEALRVIRLTVTNTSPDGFALDLWPVTAVFAAVTVRGNGAEANFDATGGSIVERGLRGPAVPLLFDFRFELAPGTVPGRYPWPLQFSVRPLTAPID